MLCKATYFARSTSPNPFEALLTCMRGGTERTLDTAGADPEGGLWGLETPPSKKCLIPK